MFPEFSYLFLPNRKLISNPATSSIWMCPVAAAPSRHTHVTLLLFSKEGILPPRLILAPRCKSNSSRVVERDENLEPPEVGLGEGSASWRFHLCVHLRRDWTHIQRSWYISHAVLWGRPGGGFLMRLFQRSDDVRVAAMLKQIGDDVKRKQDRRPCQQRQGHI